MILLNILAHDTLNEQADAPGWILPVVLAVVVIAFVAIGAVILKGIMAGFWRYLPTRRP